VISSKLFTHNFESFVNRVVRFADAYRRGLNGHQAAWAAKKYHGHRILPDSIMEELDKADLLEDVPL
jgi:hypothetical protein